MRGAVLIGAVALLSVMDLERNDGSAEKPYYMSKELMRILGKKNASVVDVAKNKKK